MGALIRAHNWGATPLGPIEQWPQSLRSALGICLGSNSATSVCWGPDHHILYNDAWVAFLGDRHPQALGRPAREVMADIWPVIEAQFRTVFERAETFSTVDTLLVRERDGARVDTYWSYSLIPVASEDGTIGGILAQARETTETVQRMRRDALLLRMAEQLRSGEELEPLLAGALALIAEEVDADWIGYAEVDEEAATMTVLHCLQKHGGADIRGTYPIPDFGAAINADLHAGRTIRMDDIANDPRLAEAEVRPVYESRGVASSLVVPILGGRSYRAMLFAHHGRPRLWSDHEEALLRAATDRIWREVSRSRAEAALRLGEQRYRRIFEQANDLIFTADLDQILTDCNPAAAEALGYSREELIGRSIAEFVTPQGFEQTTQMLQRKLDQGGTTRHDIAVKSRSGKLLYWEINSSLTTDVDGKAVALHAIARDVTERRLYEDRQKLLVNELNHRVKNTLALVQGLALQSFKGDRTFEEKQQAFEQRLAALAAAHDLLTRESWEGATLAELVQSATHHCNVHGDKVRAQGPDLKLRPKAAVSFVLALHELCTNALKYGALSRAEGWIDVTWRIVEDEKLHLEWREHGGPPAMAPTRRGFGLRMIERALAADLSGNVALDFGAEGLSCRIEAPLAQTVAEA